MCGEYTKGSLVRLLHRASTVTINSFYIQDILKMRKCQDTRAMLLVGISSEHEYFDLVNVRTRFFRATILGMSANLHCPVLT